MTESTTKSEIKDEAGNFIKKISNKKNYLDFY